MTLRPPLHGQLTERDHQEANAVTSTGSGHQFEIQLGHLCNNRCVFCHSGQLTEIKVARPIPIDPIVAAIEEAARQGARRVTFLGGEPTLHKGFLDALRRAVELGFPEIVLFTNGVLLPQPGFIDKVCALGRFEWRISIQGGNEAAHVAVTKRPASFQRIVEGLELLRERGQRVTANMCVNEESYRSLPDYVDLVRRYGLSQLHIDIVRPSSIGDYTEDYLRAIMPRYSVMAPYFATMLSRFEAELPDFDINVGNLPYCILPEYAARIHHGGEETFTKSCNADGLEAGVDKYEWHASMRRHPPQCEDCAFRPSCTGVFGEYLALYGDEEFQPVPRDRVPAAALARLRGIGPEARAEASRRARTRMLQAVAVLQRRRSVGAFQLSAFRSLEGGQSSLIELRDAAGSRVEVRFAVADRAGRPDLAVETRAMDAPAAGVVAEIAGEIDRLLKALPAA